MLFRRTKDLGGESAKARSSASSSGLIESLEGRQLCSATATQTSGVLTIQGTSVRDHIMISDVQVGNVTGVHVVDVTQTPNTDCGTFFGTTYVVAYGYAGDDEIDASATSKPCSLYGGDGNDYLFGGSGSDDLEGGADTDMLFGGANDDALFGDSGDDYLEGDDGDDFLSGDVGNDTLEGDDGADILHGDDGDDHFAFLQDGDPDYVDGGSGTDTVHGPHDSVDTLISIENFV